MDAENVKEQGNEATGPVRPNMLLLNAKGMSSTFARVDLSHSILTQVRLFNSRLHQTNFESAAIDECDFDGSTFTGCSFRGVELVNCDVDRLVINGLNIGALMRLFGASMTRG
jgi:uncharacterized protein YjbI with pentapeptide repeats